MEKKPLPAMSGQVSLSKYCYLTTSILPSADMNIACAGKEYCDPDFYVARNDFPCFGLEFVSSGAGNLLLGGRQYPLHAGVLFCYDVPSKRSRPSGSRVSNDENETPPDAEHGAARKQRRTQRGRTATPPLRSAPRRARAASPSDSGTSQESDEDTGYELTRQQEQRAQQQQQTQAHAGGGEEAEEGLGIQRCGSPDNEVRSEEDPASDADDFVPEEARCPSACVSCLLWSSERLIATPMPAGRKSHWRALMLQVLAEEFELRSQGLPGQLDCMRVRATSLHICTCCVVTKLKPSVAGKHYHLTRHDSLRWHSDPCLPPSA